jgi:predicted ferric reductase
MEPFRKQEGNRYYLQKLNKKTGELDWVEIDLIDSSESLVEELPSERVINKPSNSYYLKEKK